MNHAIKEQISDNTIYVEVEPQPKAIADNYFHYGNIVCSLAALESEYCPISIGDTVNGRKVVGIEVESMLRPDWDHEFSHVESDKAWFWKYSLEEI